MSEDYPHIESELIIHDFINVIFKLDLCNMTSTQLVQLISLLIKSTSERRKEGYSFAIFLFAYYFLCLFY